MFQIGPPADEWKVGRRDLQRWIAIRLDPFASRRRRIGAPHYNFADHRARDAGTVPSSGGTFTGWHSRQPAWPSRAGECRRVALVRRGPDGTDAGNPRVRPVYTGDP